MICSFFHHLNIRLPNQRPAKQQGFTIIELLVATAIGIAAILVVSQLLIFVQSQFVTLQKRIKDEAEISQLSFYLHHYLSMAVNLTAVTNIPPTANINSSFGAIDADFNMNNWVPQTGNGSVTTIAYFLRDTLSSRDALQRPMNVDRFVPTGLFFQRPSIDKYGALYISTENKGAIQISPQQISPDQIFGSIVDFKVLDISYHPLQFRSANLGIPSGPIYQMVSSVTFEVTQRHYLPQVPPQNKSWCPPQFMSHPKCVHGQRSYRDVSKTLTVKIKNNLLTESLNQRVSFQPLVPQPGGFPLFVPRIERTYDNVYFLRPSYPQGALKR